jgi:hypothetical protein
MATYVLHPFDPGFLMDLAPLQLETLGREKREIPHA